MMFMKFFLRLDKKYRFAIKKERFTTSLFEG